ncbi:retrovirus-related pol polyprotein from transposon TNT 1-94, partial [Tanacetum coccineum]
YYKDDPCWSADLKSKTTEDIITIRSFMEVLILNQYVLVRKILATPNDEDNALNSPNSSNTIKDESGNATSMGDKSISKGNSQHTKNVLIFFDQNNVRYDIPSNISTENNEGMQPAGNRRSTRTTKIPAKFNDYMVNSSVKYGLEKVNINDLPKGRELIGCKWIFKIKYKALGEIERYKARLVSKGFNQREVLIMKKPSVMLLKLQLSDKIDLRFLLSNNSDDTPVSLALMATKLRVVAHGRSTGDKDKLSDFKASSEVHSESSYFSDENSLVDDIIDKSGLGCNSFEASTSGITETKFVKSQNETSSGGGPPIAEDGPHNAQTSPKANQGHPVCSYALGSIWSPGEWIKDSGCSKHMTGNRNLFSTYKVYNGGNVIFGSNLCGNIIDKGQICANKCKVIFSKHDSEITKDGKVISRAQGSHKAKNIVSTTRCLELLHMDLFGPSAVRSYGGNLYTLVIVDDYSRTDHGREFDNEVQFGEFYNANGITHNFLAPHTLQSNGVVERNNKTLQETIRTMLNEQSLP